MRRRADRAADRPNPATDEIRNAAADHFDERQLWAIVLMIAFTTCANRITRRSGANQRVQPHGHCSVIIAGLLATVFLVAGSNKLFIPREKLAKAPGGGWVLDFSAGSSPGGWRAGQP